MSKRSARPDTDQACERHARLVKLTSEVSEFLDTQRTPYGSLLQHVKLPMHNEDPYDWLVINPFALLWLKSQACEGFSKTMTKYANPAAPGDTTCNGWYHLMLYTDECTPGNAK
eukprot:1745289-Karenia_brevis.AAC.1